MTFRTEPRIGAELIRNVAVLDQVKPDWVVADAEYGRAGHFLDELELLEQRYVVEVPVTTAVRTAAPAACVPADSGRGRRPPAPTRDAVRTVAAVAEVRHRQPGPPSRLLIRRSLGGEPEVKYSISNAAAETPPSTLALVACIRCRVGEYFEDCKSYLGMTRYETRSRVGWHRHMTLVGLAHLFVTPTRRRLPKKSRSRRWTVRCGCWRRRGRSRS